MPYKTADQIAELFFSADRTSTTEADSMTKIEWQTWKYWLTAKQGSWLMGQARREDNVHHAANHKDQATGRFGEHFWTATEVGANHQVMFEVTLKIADHSQDAARDKAFYTGIMDAEDGKPSNAPAHAPYEADYARGYDLPAAAFDGDDDPISKMYGFPCGSGR